MSEINYAKQRILLVDDQRPFLIMLKSILNNMGARRITMVANGEAAVKECARKDFDILFVDYDLGTTRKNGRQLLEELRAKRLIRPDSLFILVTGENHRPMVLGAMETQPDDYLIKPFSQSGLSLRVQRVYNKKTALKDIYIARSQNNTLEAIEACKKEIVKDSKYRFQCIMMLTELLWEIERYDDVEKLLAPFLKEEKVPWAMLALAKNCYFKGMFDESIALAARVVKRHKLLVEAHDIMAQCHFKQLKLDDAFIAIKKAIELSPYSIERQQIGAQIGMESEDFLFVKNCCQAVLEQNKMSVHKHISHFLNYIRSIVDVAANSEDKKVQNRFQQEALMALQRGKQEDWFDSDLHFECFEKLLTAKVESLGGRLQQAKKILFDTQDRLDQHESSYAKDFVQDSIGLMYDLGEFEQAQKMMSKINPDDLDPFTISRLKHKKESVDEIIKKFETFNKEGIQSYTAGLYHEAIDKFKQAIEIAPMNTGAALNLIQATLKILLQQKVPEDKLVNLCRRTFKIVEGMSLPSAQQQRYADLREEAIDFLLD